MKLYQWMLGVCATCLAACMQIHEPDQHIGQAPVIYPDYADVTFPPNIVSPNFLIQEEGESYQTGIGIKGSSPEIWIQGSSPKVDIPVRQWKPLLEKAKGKKIYFRVSVLRQGQWTEYADVEDSISMHPVDPFLVYRLLYPGYELWNEMGIYQRDLTSFTQTPIAENRAFDKQCINCHTFAGHSPETMMVHVRGKQGGTLIYRNGHVEKVNPTPAGFRHGATYPAWHPSGKYIAFSTNEIQQFFHASGKKAVEVSDLGADLMVYDVENQQAYTDSLVYGEQYMETFPTWSPDGNMLYFCRAKGYRKGMPLDSIRYDLWRIRFDCESKAFHAPECVYEASALRHSVSFPRISPNGRYLMFTRSDYGNFSIWHPESDLFLLDLSTGTVRQMQEVNSEDVESFHTWSSSGHWFVFSSKRMDGLWARPYLACFDPETGRAAKPFLLPQRDPEFYDTFTYTFNLPELIKAPVSHGDQLIRTVKGTSRK